MSVKMRLARHGRKKRPFYRIVVADSRRARDGRFIEILGTYNPLTNPARVTVNQGKAFHWLGEGVELTGTVERILRNSGVLARYEAVKGGEELREEEMKISMDLFAHELDSHGSKRKGKRKVASGPADEAPAAVEAPAEVEVTAEAPAEAEVTADATAEAPAKSEEPAADTES